MTENEEILVELRKIGAWADGQRKLTKWARIIIAIVILPLIVAAVVMIRELDEETKSLSGSADKPKWGDVYSNIRGANPDEAIRIGEELIQKMPQYPEGHVELASAYLAAGKFEKAREHYAEAFRLFPSEANAKLLTALDKRINAVVPQTETRGAKR